MLTAVPSGSSRVNVARSKIDPPGKSINSFFSHIGAEQRGKRQQLPERQRRGPLSSARSETDTVAEATVADARGAPGKTKLTKPGFRE